MLDPKYVVFEEIQEGYLTLDLVMIIFPSFIQHSTIIDKFKSKPISAGFVDLKNKNCYGKSTSLKNLPSREIDNMLLKDQYNL